MPSLSPATGYVVANALVLVWDLLVAGRIINNRRGTPFFLALTALAALLLVPAAVVAATADSLLNGRAIYLINWLWPLVLGVFALQATTAWWRRWVSRWVGLPVVVFNWLLFAIAAARLWTLFTDDLAAPVAALGAAQASVLAFAFGREVLLSPIMLQIPVLVASYPARARSGKTLRALLVVWATVPVLLFVMEYPAAVHATATFASFATERLQERPRGDFVLGLRILPLLEGPPSAIAVREDFAVTDSVNAAAVAVVVRPGQGTGALALDSLARALDDLRRDSVLVVVSIGYGERDGVLLRERAGTYWGERLTVVDRVVRRLHPNLLFPAHDPHVAGAKALGTVDDAAWQEYLRDAAALAHRLRPGTRVGVSLAAFTARDSALLAWAGSEASGMDVIGISLSPSYGGGGSLTSRFHIAERWIAAVRKPIWVFGTGAPPRIYGSRNQERALWGELAWATSQQRVEGFIVDGAGDYDALVGLRAPGGRLRPATSMLARARKMLVESRGMD